MKNENKQRKKLMEEGYKRSSKENVKIAKEMESFIPKLEKQVETKRFEFGDKVTDVVDTPERNYIVLKRLKGNGILLINKNLDYFYKIHRLRLRFGWNQKLKSRLEAKG